MRIGLDGKEKKQNHFDWYFLAFLLGLAIFIVSLISIKILFIVGEIIFQNWIWFVVGIVALFMLNRFLKRPKKIKREYDPYEYQYR